MARREEEGLVFADQMLFTIISRAEGVGLDD